MTTNYDHEKKEKFENIKKQETKQKEEAKRKLASDPRKNISAGNKIIRSSSFFSFGKKTDSIFFLALGIASFKDLVDLFGLSGIGIIIVTITTILTFILISFLVLMTISLGGGGSLQIFLILLGGATTEIIPGIDLLPATMAMVVTIYILILKKRKKNSEKIQQNQTAQESYV